MKKTITPDEFFAQCRRDAPAVIEKMIESCKADPEFPAMIPDGACMKLMFHIHADASIAGPELVATELSVRCEAYPQCPASIEFAPGVSLNDIRDQLVRRNWRTMKAAGGATVVLCPRCAPARPSPTCS